MELSLSLLPVLLIGIPLFLWVSMLIHAVKKTIPNKSLWLLTLILGNFIGGIVYYFAVYKIMSKAKGGGIDRVTILVTISVTTIILCTLLFIFSAISQPSKLKDVPLSEVIQQANRGQIKSIEVTGENLKITKQGDVKPTERARKEKGSSLYEQGLTNKNVRLDIRNR